MLHLRSASRRVVAARSAARSVPAASARRAISRHSGKDDPPAKLVLSDGTVYHGYSFGAPTSVGGEVVFNTGMVGYSESLTDPSFAGEVIVQTMPLQGNRGVPSWEADEFGLPKYFESRRIWAQGMIVADYSHDHSHWTATRSLSQWLKDEGVPGIYGIDTRAVTKRIREHGSMLGRIEVDGAPAAELVDWKSTNLVARVSTREPRVYNPDGDVHIVAVDCGMKNNIIRCLAQRGARVTVVPHDFDVASLRADGYFYSNGPGDPAQAEATVANLRHLLAGDTPIFGICLGNQLLARAAGWSTYKLPFGHRGQNQPVVEAATGRAFITPQNHGYAVGGDAAQPEGWRPFFTNANDGSNEGIIHTSKPFFSVQFHPEARGGPHDTSYLFDRFLHACRLHKSGNLLVATASAGRSVADAASAAGADSALNVALSTVSIGGGEGSAALASGVTASSLTGLRPPRKVVVLGSGGLSIGQAGEFDYSGSQAIKAYREDGVETVLINPNIATIQTAKGLADKVYYLPVTPDFVERVIERERPDAIALSFGGQTALNCGIELEQSGVLARHGVRVLGTSVESIIRTEDRKLFCDALEEIGEKFPRSIATASVEEAVAAAHEVGFPVICRVAYALGGLGSGFCENEEELRELTSRAFTASPQVLVEKDLRGWKEVEYEVVRDGAGNCVTVCNMENFDPLGLHTGESVVVAPSQTLNNDEYHMLRETAIRVISHLGIVGECNIQYALDPHSLDYAIIEVNPRLSRSSALASKATGYPLAFVAAKIGMGASLPQLANSVTRVTTACFEPSLDYCVVKYPRWDLRKFRNVSPHLGSQMRSVGEVMSVGRTFEEAIQKAIRMVNDSLPGFEPGHFRCDEATVQVEGGNLSVEEELRRPTDQRVLAIADALYGGTHTVDQVHDVTRIDRWFLHKLSNIAHVGNAVRSAGSLRALTAGDASLMRLAKTYGFSDAQIGSRVGASELEVRAARIASGVLPVVKQIDTLAAEYPAMTNYLYMTYRGTEDDVTFDDSGTMVLGSGSYRIGSSVEFDYCSVETVRALRAAGQRTVMVNCNPETVSTDYDESDRLYFEEGSLERVLDIYEKEAASGVIVSVGGQQPNNIALKLHRYGARVLGTSPLMIDACEDRDQYSSMLDRIGVQQPAWTAARSVDDALGFARRVGYPLLIRPSYVLSGAAMKVVHDDDGLRRFLAAASDVSPEHPVVVTEFISDAVEVDVDAVAANGELKAFAISEHLEKHTHSGDATLILPPQPRLASTLQRLRRDTERIAAELNISGPFNTQFLVRGDWVGVIETNLRASRSLPFVSKVLDVDFVRMAAHAIMGMPVPYASRCDEALQPGGLAHVGVKAPQFSFRRLPGADPVLGVEMASTGEVACFGRTLPEAYLKSIYSAGFVPPAAGAPVYVLAEPGENPVRDAQVSAVARRLEQMGHPVVAGSQATADALRADGVAVAEVQDRCVKPLRSRRVGMVLDLSSNHDSFYHIRRNAVDYSVPLITNLEQAELLVDSLAASPDLAIVAHDEYFEAADYARRFGDAKL